MTIDYFTFHNVSINTQNSRGQCSSLKMCFTFHNVSINTELWMEGDTSKKLYIPQCFY